jgi:hypothetical protein
MYWMGSKETTVVIERSMIRRYVARFTTLKRMFVGTQCDWRPDG